MTHFSPIQPQAPFACDPQLWRRFVDTCRARDETPGAVLRDLIRLEVQRVERRSARSDKVIDERLLGRLRLLVAQALISAQTWDQLQVALGENGLAYVAAGGGLNLADPQTGEILCKGSQAGPGYLDLVRKMGCGFPGHPRPGLAQHAMTPLPGQTALHSTGSTQLSANATFPAGSGHGLPSN